MDDGGCLTLLLLVVLFFAAKGCTDLVSGPAHVHTVEHFAVHGRTYGDDLSQAIRAAKGRIRKPDRLSSKERRMKKYIAEYMAKHGWTDRCSSCGEVLSIGATQ